MLDYIDLRFWIQLLTTVVGLGFFIRLLATPIHKHRPNRMLAIILLFYTVRNFGWVMQEMMLESLGYVQPLLLLLYSIALLTLCALAPSSLFGYMDQVLRGVVYPNEQPNWLQRLNAFHLVLVTWFLVFGSYNLWNWDYTQRFDNVSQAGFVLFKQPLITGFKVLITLEILVIVCVCWRDIIRFFKGSNLFTEDQKSMLVWALSLLLPISLFAVFDVKDGLDNFTGRSEFNYIGSLGLFKPLFSLAVISRFALSGNTRMGLPYYSSSKVLAQLYKAQGLSQGDRKEQERIITEYYGHHLSMGWKVQPIRSLPQAESFPSPLQDMERYRANVEDYLKRLEQIELSCIAENLELDKLHLAKELGEPVFVINHLLKYHNIYHYTDYRARHNINRLLFIHFYKRPNNWTLEYMSKFSGFSSYQSMLSQFKKHKGVLPTHYLRKLGSTESQ